MDENNNKQNAWEQQPQQTQWEQQPQQMQWQQGTPPYQPPYQQNNSLSVGEWLLTFIIIAVPCVGLIMLFMWAFGNEGEPRKNFARAYLIIMLISIVLGIIFSGIIVGSMASLKLS